MIEEQGYTPPHSSEAEQSILGGVLLANPAFDRVAGMLREEDFFRQDHRLIWRTIASLIERGQAADVITVADALTASGHDAGGMVYLNQLAQNTPGADGVRSYAEIVVERAKKRSLMATAATLMQEAPGARPAAEVAADCELALMASMDRTTSDPVQMEAAMGEAFDYIEERQSGKRGLLSGLRDLDALTAGFEPGQLIIIAARPSVGKTVLGVNLADAAAQAGQSVLFFSLEMPRREIAMRLLSSRAQVPLHAMRAQRLQDRDYALLAAARERSGEQRLFIDDTGGIGVNYVRAKARRQKRKYGLGLIVIDYLGLMTGKGDSRTLELGSISRGLKGLAKELAVPIVALAQLNRGLESRGDKRPQMSDLRDSGEIEQDADIVAMLHREDLHHTDAEWAGLAELLIRKNRNGPLGTVVLEFDGECMAFHTTDRPLPTASILPMKRQALR